MYNNQHNKEMSVSSLAQLASTILYGRRFFPYYTFNILGGLDEKGVGAVYSFDPVGSFEREGYRAGGSAAALIQPFLDNQIGGKNLAIPQPELTLEYAIKITKDAFTSAAERDIHTGDFVEIWVITSAGVQVEKFDIRKD